MKGAAQGESGMNRLLLLIAVSFFSTSAGAAESYVDNLQITQIIIDNNRYSGCMVKVSPELPASTNCGRLDFVSLDCDGEYGTKAKAQSMLEMAQLAFLTDKSVRLRVDDDYPIINGTNSFCTANYIRLDK